jgi:hypothetical protein
MGTKLSTDRSPNGSEEAPPVSRPLGASTGRTMIDFKDTSFSNAWIMDHANNSARMDSHSLLRSDQHLFFCFQKVQVPHVVRATRVHKDIHAKHHVWSMVIPVNFDFLN